MSSKYCVEKEREQRVRPECVFSNDLLKQLILGKHNCNEIDIQLKEFSLSISCELTYDNIDELYLLWEPDYI